MEFDRRALLKLGGGAGLGGALLGIARTLKVAPKDVAPPPSFPMSSQVEAPIPSDPPALSPVQQMLQDFNSHRESRWVQKDRNLDLDIRVLGSVSESMKYHMQRMRDQHNQNVIERLHKMAYPRKIGDFARGPVCGEGQATMPGRGY